jgi:transposase InsO family protein
MCDVHTLSPIDVELLVRDVPAGGVEQDIFEYTEMFYNPKRRHSFSNDMSPAKYEKSISSGSQVSRKAVAIHPC